MLEVTIGQLADIVDGRLCLGTMPPIDGRDTWAGRIVTDSRQVRPGNIFWALPGTRQDGAHFIEDALMRGAQGTISEGRYIEPWAGRFSLRVPDSRQALLKLARRARTEYSGWVIGVAAGPDTRLQSQTLRQLLSPLRPEMMRAHGPRNAARAALDILDWTEYDACAVVEFGDAEKSEIHEISHLCHPQIAAITRTRQTHPTVTGNPVAFAETQTRLLSMLPPDTVAVLDGDDPWTHDLPRRAAERTVRVGFGNNCDIVATRTAQDNGHAMIRLEGLQFSGSTRDPEYVRATLIALAVGRLLGLPQADLQSAVDAPVAAATGDSLEPQQDILEVPSSALALREVNATLPPGLERYTC